MLNVIILWIFSCGIELGVIVLCLLPLRFILRRKVPRLFSYLLWGAVPVTVVASFCMKNMPVFFESVAEHSKGMHPVIISESAVTVMKWCMVLGSVAVWSVMLVYFLRFRSYLIGSIKFRENIYLCARIDGAFSGGLIQPKIYIPSVIGEEYREFVISHEQVHIKRKDIWMKYLAIGLLALFWFQPILWCAYQLFINDMEEACDETVLRGENMDFRANYARTLLELSEQTRKVKGLLLGFGNGAIKERIRHAALYKKESTKLRIIAMVICMLFVLGATAISWKFPRLVNGGQRTEITDERPLSLGTQSMDDELIQQDE